MRLTQISLQLWVLTACTGGTALPPPGQPSPPPSSPPAAPVATTLEETEAQLREDIAGTERTTPARSFITVYFVNDRRAIDLLTDWFRRQESVADVRLHESVSRTWAQGTGSQQAGAVYVAEDEWWELEVVSPAKAVMPDDVTAWLQLLRAVPDDARWRLGPSRVSRP